VMRMPIAASGDNRKTPEADIQPEVPNSGATH
jgi:hypothetical protein